MMTLSQYASIAAGLACIALGVSMLVSPFLWRVIDFVFGLGFAVFAAAAIVIAVIFVMLSAAHAASSPPGCSYAHCYQNGMPDPDDPNVQTDLRKFHRWLREAQIDCHKDMTPYVNYQECVMMTYALSWEAEMNMTCSRLATGIE